MCALAVVNCGPSKQDDTRSKADDINAKLNAMSIREKLLQRLIIDFRYFCPDNTPEQACRTPVTKISPDIEYILSQNPVGGVVLFAENIENPAQTLRLTQGLKSILKTGQHPALMIAIDQEGGKVARTNRAWSTTFAGNAALAAAPEDLQPTLAFDVGKVIGRELNALGINVNFAPVVDVNSNPNNPVINARSFSDKPTKVSELANFMIQGMQVAGIAPTLKHFPGHGDTGTDSHFGLPSVDHNHLFALKHDIAPYQQIFKQRDTHDLMVMTAHIQYPAFDPSTLTALDGQKVIKPATLSRVIVTDLLRGALGFEGVTISDAMDMRAISKLLAPHDAVAAAMRAGVDMILMPLELRNRHASRKLTALLNDLEKRVHAGEISLRTLDKSVARILKFKQLYRMGAAERLPIDLIGGREHKTVERRLANHSVSEVLYPKEPILKGQFKSVTVIMPTRKLADAFMATYQRQAGERAKGVRLKTYEITQLTPDVIKTISTQSDLIIAGNVTPADSPVNHSGMADLEDMIGSVPKRDSQILTNAGKTTAIMRKMLRTAKIAGKKTAFISFRYPSDIRTMLTPPRAIDAAYAVYSFNVYMRPNLGLGSPSLDALMAILLGDSHAVGQLPVAVAHAGQKNWANITVGAERIFHGDNFPDYIGSADRLGLVVNQSSQVFGGHLVDAFLERGMPLSRLFAVEHGVRGTKSAGEHIINGIDQPTGLPISSLYGKHKGPTNEMLADVDTLIFDLQDVGVRFYTYLSSLHHVMQSCAAFDTPLIVLDRPNPNGAYIDGPVLRSDFQSFVGMHPIPLLHGMTLGELALMINGEGWLKDGAQCDLRVVDMAGYRHDMSYELPVRPSPNLPNAQAIRLYPSLALFEATSISVGRGTDFPFQVLGGLQPKFGAFTFTPKSRAGALHPLHADKTLYGDDYRGDPTQGFSLQPFITWSQKMPYDEFLTKPHWLDTLAGTDQLRKDLKAGLSETEIRDTWQADLTIFKAKRAKYILYPD